MDSKEIKDSYIVYIKENTHVNLLEGDSQEVITLMMDLLFGIYN